MIYDIIILGSGPAGLAAAVAARGLSLPFIFLPSTATGTP